MADEIRVRCLCCGTPVVLRDAEGRTIVLAEYATLGLRLNTLQHHAVPACRRCAADVRPEQCAALTEQIKALATADGTAVQWSPEDFAQLEVIGTAAEFRGLEDGARRPVIVPEHGPRRLAVVPRAHALEAHRRAP